MTTEREATRRTKATGSTNKPSAPPPAQDTRAGSELNDFIEELRAERAHWLERLEKRQSLAHTLSEDLAEPEDDAAAGAAQRDTDRLEPMVERAARRVDAIQHALERAVQGRLTECESCGRSIALERLRAVPDTTLCVECARARERELRPAGA